MSTSGHSQLDLAIRLEGYLKVLNARTDSLTFDALPENAIIDIEQ